ncbi:MAG: serine/threonine protein kinase [Acidobacteria bacterium]|nr:serine/threonine protein kinase [Acidobacteriota bacterium]
MLESGIRLGPYEILAPLGAGGMGEVYRARDTRLGRTVAIKTLSPVIRDLPNVRERFIREARTVSNLSHPGICALFDVGEQDGIDYLVMEFLEGETLAERLRRGPLTPAEFLRYSIQMADALEYAHHQAVIHSDLKPGNVMMTTAGAPRQSTPHAKLLDFGLANAARTPHGGIAGTFQYMAPEQLHGGHVDARTDIFAFGATMYEMSSGRRAFSGNSQASLVEAIIGAEPPPLDLSRDLPARLQSIVMRCLAKDPAARYQSAAEIGDELRRIHTHAAGVQTKPAAAMRRALIFAATVLAIAGAALYFWATRPASPTPSPASSPEIPTTLPESSIAPATKGKR